MRKRELAQAVASHTDVDPKVAAKVINGTLDVILATVAKGEDVALTGFAKFSKVEAPGAHGPEPRHRGPGEGEGQDRRQDRALEGLQGCRARRCAGTQADQGEGDDRQEGDHRNGVAGQDHPPRHRRKGDDIVRYDRSGQGRHHRAVTPGHPIGLAGSSAASRPRAPGADLRALQERCNRDARVNGMS